MMQTIKHEIRTPLNGISGIVTTLKKKLKGYVDSETTQLMNICIYSCSMIQTLLCNFEIYAEEEAE